MFGFFGGVLVFRLVGSPQRAEPAQGVDGDRRAVRRSRCSASSRQTPELRPYIELHDRAAWSCPLLLVCGRRSSRRTLFTKLFASGRRASPTHVYILHYPVFGADEAAQLALPGAVARAGAVDGHRAASCRAGDRLVSPSNTTTGRPAACSTARSEAPAGQAARHPADGRGANSAARSRLLRHPAAVDRQRGAVDLVGGVAGEKHRELRRCPSPSRIPWSAAPRGSRC